MKKGLLLVENTIQSNITPVIPSSAEVKSGDVTLKKINADNSRSYQYTLTANYEGDRTLYPARFFYKLVISYMTKPDENYLYVIDNSTLGEVADMRYDKSQDTTFCTYTSWNFLSALAQDHERNYGQVLDLTSITCRIHTDTFVNCKTNSIVDDKYDVIQGSTIIQGDLYLTGSLYMEEA